MNAELPFADKTQAEQKPVTDDDEPQSHSHNNGPARLTPGFLDRVKALWPFRQNASLRQDLEGVLEQGDADLTFTPEERAMLSNILALREVRADDIMIPRADIDAVDVTIPLGQLMFLFEESRHSRMPVYREMLDDPIGMVHVKDVMGIIMDQAEENPKDCDKSSRNDVIDYDLSNVDLTQSLSDVEILRPLLFVPPSMSASDIFAKMRAARTQMALVIDEYGGTDGLVSMEDVVEAVVGDIEDEYDDEEEETIICEAQDRWIVDARAPVGDVFEALGLSIDLDGDDDDIHTIGGFLFTELGRVPVRGEVVCILGEFDFEILEADPRRIRRVRILRTKPAGKRRRRATGEDSMKMSEQLKSDSE